MKFFFVTICSVFSFFNMFSQESQTLGLTEVEQKIWEEHLSEIIMPVTLMSEEVYATLDTNYLIKQHQEKAIKQYCFTKELRKYICNYRCPDVRQRIVEKNKINDLYQDSINILLLPYNPILSGIFISWVLQKQKNLGINDNKYTSILKGALHLCHIVRDNPCNNIAQKEMEILKNNLSHNQVCIVINSVNHKDAEISAKNVWKRLQNAGMVEPKDSSNYIKDAYSYFQKEMYIRNYYIGEQDLINNNLRDLYLHKPIVIKKMDGLQYQKVIKRQHEERVGAEYSW